MSVSMTNKHNNVRNSEHTEAEKAKGDNLMKNTIKTNRTNEINAKKAAEEAAKKAQALKEIKPLNIVETLKQLEESKTDAKVVCDKDGNPVAVCGGKYLCEVYKGEVIGAETQEQLNAIKARVDKGIHGDGLLHKMVTINGKNIPCVGKTEKEIDKDVESLEIYSKQHPAEPRRDLTVATMLQEAGYKAENIEQVTVQGNDYLLVYEDGDGLKNYMMDLNGSTIKDKNNKEVNLNDIEDELSRKTVKILLLERLEKAVASKKPEPKPAPQPKPEAPKSPKTTKSKKAAHIEVEVRPCGILISKRLRSYSLSEIIEEVLRYQEWKLENINGNPRCPYLYSAHSAGGTTQEASEEVMRTAVRPTVTFIEERIVQESPIYADSIELLTKKISDIVYEALKEEPYFGMPPSVGTKLSRYIAEAIMRNADILYR